MASHHCNHSEFIIHVERETIELNPVATTSSFFLLFRNAFRILQKYTAKNHCNMEITIMPKLVFNFIYVLCFELRGLRFGLKFSFLLKPERNAVDWATLDTVQH
jgi:hypothetical protein